MDIKTKIMQADDLPKKEVIIPEWDVQKGELFVRGLSGAEQGRLKAKLETSDDLKSRAVIAAFVLVDKDGKRVFNDDEIELLDKKSGSALNKVMEAYFEVNGVSEAEVSEKKGS